MAKNKKRKLIHNPYSIPTTSEINKNPDPPKPSIPARPDSGSDSDSDPAPVQVEKLLEPYSRDRLVALAVDAAAFNHSFYNYIVKAADNDITHRKIFVHGLAREATRQTLITVFEQFGEIEECNVVMDPVTGKAKGYAFVVFKTRKSAVKALKEPQKMISGRLAYCKLAAVKESSDSWKKEVGSRKIYVSNVRKDVNSDELRTFFSKFGEIEAGPIGFDPHTGKTKGYALFVYKTVEDANRCLEEPHKTFKGGLLHCKKAAEGKGGCGAASITSEVVQMPYGAVAAAAQNVGMMGMNPNMAMMNPLYGAVIANPYGGYVNPFVGVGGFGQPMGVAGYGGLLHSLGGGASVLGAYGSGAGGSSMGGSSGLLQAYPNNQVGQPSPAKLPGSSGYSSHLR